MRVNKITMEILRGTWFLQPGALSTYGPIAYNLLYGEQKSKAEIPEPEAILTVITKQGNSIRPLESETRPDIPQGSIAVVDAIGVLTKYGDWCTYGALDIVAALRYADSHPNIVATVFNVDGPGGSTGGISPFVEFGKTKKKPVVGIYDTSCSAHLYAMLAVSDYVMASNNISSLVGSIGVVASWADNRKYLEGLGFVFHEVYPEESKHKNEVFRLAMEGKYDMIKKEMLSPAAIQFQNFVKEKRPQLVVDHPGLLTGKTFGADEALKVNLIDKIGSFEEAVEIAKMMSEIKNK